MIYDFNKNKTIILLNHIDKKIDNYFQKLKCPKCLKCPKSKMSKFGGLRLPPDKWLRPKS